MAAKLWKYLQKPASFSIRTESPRASAARTRAVFSGPIGVSIIPEEARTKRRGGEGEAALAFEPTSPKVSCIGQVKKQHHKKIKSFKDKKNKIKSKIKKPASEEEERRDQAKKKPPVAPSGIRQMFRRKVRPGRREEEEEVEAVPEIGTMRRFRSGREALADFDWRTTVESGSDVEYDEEEVIVPHSAPILMGGGEVATEPKREVNLWKRRTVAPPVPLEIK